MALYDRIMDGVRMAEAGRAAGRRSKLESLLGDAYSNPQGRQQAFAEAAKIDAPTTIEMQQKLADIDQEGLARAAQMLVAAPEDLRPQIYKSQVYQYGQGMGVPQEYTPFMLPMMEKLAQRGAGGGAVVHSQRVGDDGFIYNTMRDGSIVNTGVKADRQAWFRDHPGMPPQIVGKGGDVMTVGGYVQAPQSGAAILTGADGMPFRIGEDVPPQVREAIMQAEGAQRMTAPAQQALARPSEAQTAAEVEYAKQRAQLAALPERQRIEAQGAGQRESAVQGARMGAEMAEKAAQNATTLRTYEEAMSRLQTAMEGTETGAIAGRLPALTAAQQTAEGMQAAMAPILKQLFRSSGEGVFTDKDQELLMAMLPTRTDLPAARDAKIEAINAIVRTKLSAPSSGGASNQAPSSSSEDDDLIRKYL